MSSLFQPPIKMEERPDLQILDFLIHDTHNPTPQRREMLWTFETEMLDALGTESTPHPVPKPVGITLILHFVVVKVLICDVSYDCDSRLNLLS